MEENDLLTALIHDIRFKTMEKVIPQYMLRAVDGKKIRYLSDIKRDKYVFITDKYTLNKTPDKLRDLIQNYENYVKQFSQIIIIDDD